MNDPYTLADFPCDPDADPRDSLVHLGVFSMLIGIGLLFGLILSHVPQYIRIVKKNTSKGLSGTTLSLANLNHFNVALNSCITRIAPFQACSVVGFWKCFPTILSTLSLIGGFLSFYPVLILFLVYFPQKDAKSSRTHRLNVIFFLLFNLYAISVITLSYYLVKKNDRCYYIVLELAYSVGLLSSIVNLWQWIPQIVTTYKRKGSGALSIIMIAVQAPGSALMLIFLILSKASFTTWASYFTSATQQLILLYLLVFYTIRRKRRRALLRGSVNGSPESIAKKPLLGPLPLPNIPKSS
ncbi:hypothetical protein RCL1_004540 [Eukaryota sp. TZLM3-RCL]